MPRPVSWLPRLHEIRRSVDNSVRSHYDRHDLERLFELQPRAAQKLLEFLPTVTLGTSRLLEREALAKFLDGVRAAEDTSKFIEQVRQEKTISSSNIPTISLVVIPSSSAPHRTPANSPKLAEPAWVPATAALRSQGRAVHGRTGAVRATVRAAAAPSGSGPPGCGAPWHGTPGRARSSARGLTGPAPGGAP